MKDVITKKVGTNTFLYKPKTKELCIHYLNEPNANFSGTKNFKLIVEPINKISNHYTDVKETLYEKVKKHNGLLKAPKYKFVKINTNERSIKNALRILSFLKSSGCGCPDDCFPKEENIILEKDGMYYYFINDSINYFLDLFGKDTIKNAKNNLKNFYNLVIKKAKSTEKSLDNLKISNQQAITNIIRSLKNEQGFVVDSTLASQIKTYENILGIHLVGDKKFISAKDSNYLANDFNKSDILQNYLLQNYFVDIDSQKQTITPILPSKINRLISFTVDRAKDRKFNLNNEKALEHLINFNCEEDYYDETKEY